MMIVVALSHSLQMNYLLLDGVRIGTIVVCCWLLNLIDEFLLHEDGDVYVATSMSYFHVVVIS